MNETFYFSNSLFKKVLSGIYFPGISTASVGVQVSGLVSQIYRIMFLIVPPHPISNIEGKAYFMVGESSYRVERGQ